MTAKTAGAQGEATNVWEVPLAELAFSAQPDEISAAQTPRQLREVDRPAGTAETPLPPAWSARRSEGGLVFEAVGRVETMRAMHSTTWLGVR